LSWVGSAYMAPTLSVWVLPSEGTPQFKELQEVIERNSQKFNSPSFTPHITLAALPHSLSLNEIERTFKELIPEIECLPICLDSVQQGDTFHQSVFAKVDPSSSDYLQDIQEKLYRSLAVTSPNPLPHFAHLSLYYGTDSEEKSSVSQDASTMKVFEESVRVALGGLWLADCSGAVDNWKILLKVDVKAHEK